MPECRYCGREFADDETLDRHLEEEHLDELGPIDRRRIRGEDGGFDLDAGPIVLLAVLVLAIGAVVYVVFFLGGGSPGLSLDQVAQTPTGVGSAHFHGTIDVTIEGETLDFSRGEYQNPREYPAFHFEGGDGETWHGHAQGVTLEYGMATLGIGVEENAVTFDGTTYDGGDSGTTVIVEVNGEPVDPQTYELQEGDHVRIQATTSD